MIIDIHTHISDKNKLQAYRKKANMAVSKVIALSAFNDSFFDWPGVESMLKLVANEPDIYVLGSIDMSGDIQNQLALHEQLFENKKIVGIKLYPGYQHFYPYDEKVVEIAKLCEKYGKPLVFHSGDFYDPHNVALLKYSHPVHIDELAKKCPNTTIVISHFGFPYFMETANLVSRNKNVYTDISGTIAMDNSESFDALIANLIGQYTADLKRIFNYYPDVKNKVMFATDYHSDDIILNQVQPYIDVVKSLFNKEEQKSVFHGLAEKLYFSEKK